MRKILLVILFMLSFNVFSENIENLNKIDEVTKKYMENETLPGSVVLVSKNGKIVYLKAFGYAQLFDRDKKMEKPLLMNENTIFDLASLTKVMGTTQAIMKLCSEKKINVEDKVSKYIKGFEKNGKENIKIKDLLTHTSGLTPWQPIYYHSKNPKETLEYIKNMKLEYKTGTERKYSDFSFIILGFIVEKVTGQKLDDYLEKNIYLPLGMKNTKFNPKKKGITKNIAATSNGNPFEERMIKDDNFGYKVNERFEEFKNWRMYTLVGEVNDGNSFYANKGVAGHAGLFSNVKDLYILGEVLLNGGIYKGKRIYSKEVIDMFTSVQSSFGHGYGWEINRGGGESGYMGRFSDEYFVGHTGFTGTHIVYDMKNKMQIIILTNKQNYGVDKDTKYKSTWSYAREIMNIVGETFKEN